MEVVEDARLVAQPCLADAPSRRLGEALHRLEARGDEVTVELCFHLYRTRLETEVDSWIGRRTDVLRRHANSFRLARRHLFLDQTLIRSTNMSTIF